VALSQDQKKHLFIGGGIGALAMLFGSMIFGGRKAVAGPMLRHGGRDDGGHDHEPHKKHRGNGDGNDRGEYDRKKKHHRKEHGHGD
jgi:hypothetical protein